jgi:hypothetical protein
VTHRDYAFVTIALLATLAACGGGGGKGSLLPSTGTQSTTKKTGTAIFKLKLPGTSTLAKVRHRTYQSQGTQGVSIDWLSTNPYAPDYAAPITAVCPAQLPSGVASCSIDADGGTDYTFQFPIPAGTYNAFTVSTFNQTPSESPLAFAASANMLAQGTVGGFTVTAGTTTTVPNLTFYGVPSSVSFVPLAGQTHVTQYSPTTGTDELAIVGGQPQSFFAYAVDADGYTITNNDGSNTAPTIGLLEVTSDACETANGGSCVSIVTPAPSASPNIFTVAVTSAAQTITLDATATLPNGASADGTSGVSTSYPIVPAQELWVTTEAGTPPIGLFGYALYNGTTPVGPIDAYADSIGNPLCGVSGSSCNFIDAAIDPSSGTIYAAGLNAADIPVIVAFVQGTGSAGLIVPTAPVFTASLAGDSYSSIAIDSAHHGFVIDDNSGTITLEAYSTASNGWSQITTSASPLADAIAVAPKAANVPSALVGTLWVSAGAGGLLVYPAFNGSSLGSAVAASGVGSAPGVVGFDSAGDLWATTASDVDVYRVSGTAAAPVVTLLGSNSLYNVGSTGTSFGAAAGQTMWFGEGGGLETDFDTYIARCTSTCTFSGIAGQLQTSAASFAAMIAP